MGFRAEEHALITQSLKFRDAISAAVTNEHLSFNELCAQIDHVHESNIDHQWLASLGRVVALQDAMPSDHATGLKFLNIANRNLPKNKTYRRYHKLEVELLAENGQFTQARELVINNEDLRSIYHNYLFVDLHNPHVTGEPFRSDEWLQGFNFPLSETSLRTVSLDDTGGFPFDRLATKETASIGTDGPMVSVIMTSYEPEEAAFLTAAMSILNQSWINLELIIVDDASPNHSSETLIELSQRDHRVKLVLLEKNGGTYLARNEGLRLAAGKYVTGQDSDDWSHPDRIAAQVDFLENNPNHAGVVTSAIRTDERLSRIIKGQNPSRRCEVSFMTQTKTARDVGGYLPARKAADSEFRQRVEFNTRKPLGEIDKPLYFIRMMPNSLSRGDFRPGWSHQSRRAFWSATLYWHTRSAPSTLSISDRSDIPLPIPARFQITAPLPRQLDVVYACDWRSNEGAQRSTIDEIKKLKTEGLSVGIMQMESVNSPARTSTRPIREVQQLINENVVVHVIPDEGAKIRLLVLRDPAIMQFPTTQQSTLDIDEVLIIADSPPSRRDGSHVEYRPSDCTKNAREYFDATVSWISPDSHTRDLLVRSGDGISIHNNLLPPAIDIHDWSGHGGRTWSQVPVIGRHAVNLESHWPEAAEIPLAWPIDGSAEVRILGDGRGAVRRMGERHYSEHWISFKGNEIDARSFMNSLDFFIFHAEDDLASSFSREAWEAATSGCVVLLPPHFEEQHGKSAIYSRIEEVQGIVSRFVNQKDEYDGQVIAAKKYVHSIESKNLYVELIRSLLNYIPAGEIK